MSKASSLLPLVFLFLFLALAAVVGFVVYQIANDVQGQTRKKMEKRNISFTKDGMRVGVKEKTTEKYADDTQRYAKRPIPRVFFVSKADADILDPIVSS